jgi:hypothetical protein
MVATLTAALPLATRLPNVLDIGMM